MNSAKIICDYCDQDATHITIDSPEPLCKGCARSQTDGPLGDYVRPLTATAIRQLTEARGY